MLSRRGAWVIRVFSLWTVYVWVTRIGNIWDDRSRDLPFKLVHTGLAAVSVALAVAAWVVVRRARRRERAARGGRELASATR